jgi:hypothetical protein
MSLNNMYIEDTARVVKSKKGYFIQKKAALIGLVLLGVIFVGGILITYYSTKDSNETCVGSVNTNSLINKTIDNDQVCSSLFCSKPQKINGIFKYAFIVECSFLSSNRFFLKIGKIVAHVPQLNQVSLFLIEVSTILIHLPLKI